MDDRDIEALLQRYRPAGPPPELGLRVATLRRGVPHPDRTWPWAAAAAVLVALTLGVQSARDAAVRHVDAAVTASVDATSSEAFAPAASNGGDADLLLARFEALQRRWRAAQAADGDAALSPGMEPR